MLLTGIRTLKIIFYGTFLNTKPHQKKKQKKTKKPDYFRNVTSKCLIPHRMF